MRILDRYSGLFWLFLSAVVCLGARRLGLGHFRDPGPGFLFFWSGVVLFVLSLIILFQTVKPADKKESPFENVSWAKVSIVVLALVLYGLMLERLGFVLSTAIFMGLLLRAIEARRWYVVILVSVVSSLLTYALFELWLHARLPKGILGI